MFLVQNNRFYPSGGSAQFSIIGPSSNAKLANLKGDYTLLVKDNEFTLNTSSSWIMQIGVNNDTAGGYRAEFIIDGVTLRDTPATFQGIYQYVHYGTGVTLYPYSLIVRNIYNVLELPSAASLLEIQDLSTSVQTLTNIELPKFIFKQAFAVGAGSYSKQTTQSLPCIWSNRTNAVKVTATADVLAFDGPATMWADAVMATSSTVTMRLTTGNTGEVVTAGGTYGGTFIIGG